MTAAQQTFSPRLICVMFFLAIALPMVVSLAQPDAEISNAEQRTLKQWPRWQETDDLRAYFSDITEYANDQFGFREALITLRNKLAWAFGQSPSKYVIRGSDDWLFLKIRDPLLSQHAKSNITITNIIKRRAKYIADMREALEQQGIYYQYMIAANKLNVYREHLPTIYRLTNIDASYELYQSMFDKAALDLQVRSSRIIAEQKDAHEFPLYFKNDTHWNQLGAYLVFDDSINKISQFRPDLEMNLLSKQFGSYRKYSGDLARYIGLEDELVALEPYTKFMDCAEIKAATKERWDISQNLCGVNETKLLFIGDSFAEHILPYYAETFGTVYSANQNISRARLKKIIAELRPDIVIEQIVERHLAQPIPK